MDYEIKAILTQFAEELMDSLVLPAAEVGENDFEHLLSPKYEIVSVVRARGTDEMFLLTTDSQGQDMLWKPAAEKTQKVKNLPSLLEQYANKIQKIQKCL
jgi:hypothetical protein